MSSSALVRTETIEGRGFGLRAVEGLLCDESLKKIIIQIKCVSLKNQRKVHSSELIVRGGSKREKTRRGARDSTHRDR